MTVFARGGPVALSEADDGRLSQRTYGIAGISPTAAELAAAVHDVIPGC